MNDRLREAVTASGLNESEIAARLGVDQKTVARWLVGRVPYPRYRRALADTLGVVERTIWPQIRPRASSTADATSAKLQASYAHRWAVPRQVWLHLFSSAEEEIGILAYAALFLAEDDGLIRVLADRARAGVRVRILLGNPESPQVTERGIDEGIGDAIAAKTRNAQSLFQALAEVGGIEIKLHSTTLYTSIYRGDAEVLVNPHVYGVPASHAPVFHIRHMTAGDMAETYIENFDRVWNKV